MLSLSLFWLLIGAFVGLLVYWSRIPSLQHPGWLKMLVIGAISALAGGWLGIGTLGTFFATGMALWLALLMSLVIPIFIRWIILSLRRN